MALGAQERLALKLEGYLQNSETWGFRAKATMGLALSANLGYALQYVVYEGLQVGKGIVVIMVVLMGAFSLGNMMSNTQAFAAGLVAAQKIHSTINRQSP